MENDGVAIGCKKKKKGDEWARNYKGLVYYFSCGDLCALFVVWYSLHGMFVWWRG